MQRYFSNKKDNGYFLLTDDDMYHIFRVMRYGDGQVVEVVFEKEVYKCIIDGKRVKIEGKLENFKDIDLEITLIIPLLKEQKMDLILQKATELGVSRIIPVVTERTIVKIDDKEEKKLIRWSRICKEASEQCMRTTIPIIEKVRTFNDLGELTGVKFVCSTKKNIKNIKILMQSLKVCDRINIVVGPEGGLSSKEEEYLNTIGYESISLGNRIMRVETVPLYVLSVLNYECLE